MRLERLTIAWLSLSAVWVTGYLYAESLDGLMFRELREVIPMTLLPPLILGSLTTGAVHLLARLYRP